MRSDRMKQWGDNQKEMQVTVNKVSLVLDHFEVKAIKGQTIDVILKNY